MPPASPAMVRSIGTVDSRRFTRPRPRPLAVRDAPTDLGAAEENPEAEEGDGHEDDAWPTAECALSRSNAPREAADGQGRHRQSEQHMERDRALQAEEMSDTVSQSVQE